MKPGIFDGVLLLVLSWYGYRGYRRGFLGELLRFLGFFFAVTMAVTQYGFVAGILIDFGGMEDTLKVDVIAVLVTFFGVKLAFWGFSLALNKVTESYTVGKYLNRGGGISLGMMKICVVVMFLVTGVSSLWSRAPDVIARHSVVLPVMIRVGELSMAGIYRISEKFPFLVSNRFVRRYRDYLAGIPKKELPKKLYSRYLLLDGPDRVKLMNFVNGLSEEEKPFVLERLAALEVSELDELLGRVDNSRELIGYLKAR